MSGVTFENETYNDDRLYVLSVCRCTVKQVERDLLETVIHHERAPVTHLWCVTTYRNTPRYPIVRVDHFGTREDAESYLRQIEPTTPRISWRGASPSPIPSFAEYSAWKAQAKLQEYDYRRMYLPGGSDPQEVVVSRRPR